VPANVLNDTPQLNKVETNEWHFLFQAIVFLVRGHNLVTSIAKEVSGLSSVRGSLVGWSTNWVLKIFNEFVWR